MSKNKKPRDLIHRLKIPNTDSPQYEWDTRRMAELARNYHDELQQKDLEDHSLTEFKARITPVLNRIHENQILKEPEGTKMNEQITESQINDTLHLSKNGSATGMDGCPYELWKILKEWHNQNTKQHMPSFNIAQTLTAVFNDIQRYGVDESTSFALGWMCLIYKKKDWTDISNYRPITLLNTDYKLLTKVLAIQLMEHIATLIHKDQAGFIPKWSIHDHIRLAKAIITYADITEEDGAIVTLDQEKAYDKIRHDYLWKTLEAFNLPNTFIKTIRALYQHIRKTTLSFSGFIKPL